MILFLPVVALALSYVALRRPREGHREGQLPPAAPAKAEFSAEHRLKRKTNRHRQPLLIRALIDNPNTDASTKQEAGRKLRRIIDHIGRELRTQGLFWAQGCDYAWAFGGDGGDHRSGQSPRTQGPDVTRHRHEADRPRAGGHHHRRPALRTRPTPGRPLPD